MSSKLDARMKKDIVYNYVMSSGNNKNQKQKVKMKK